MAIYKPSLLDKFKDFVNGLKGNWDQYEDHVADFESHKADDVTQNGAHGLNIEQGVFTPSFNVGNHTYGEQIGRYYRIGNIVHIFMRIQVTVADKTPTENLKIVGLPFLVNGHGGSITFGYVNNTSMPTNKPILLGRITGYTSEITLTARGHDDQWPIACKASILNDGSEWYMSGSYLIGE